MQITQQFHIGEAWELRKAGTIVNETGLHIVRYSCGTKTLEEYFMNVFVASVYLIPVCL